jgi:hypothetical protein
MFTSGRTFTLPQRAGQDERLRRMATSCIALLGPAQLSGMGFLHGLKGGYM